MHDKWNVDLFTWRQLDVALRPTPAEGDPGSCIFRLHITGLQRERAVIGVEAIGRVEVQSQRLVCEVNDSNLVRDQPTLGRQHVVVRAAIDLMILARADAKSDDGLAGGVRSRRTAWIRRRSRRRGC